VISPHLWSIGAHSDVAHRQRQLRSKVCRQLLAGERCAGVACGAGLDSGDACSDMGSASITGGGLWWIMQRGGGEWEWAWVAHRCSLPQDLPTWQGRLGAQGLPC
jgi:hypothetical protein